MTVAVLTRLFQRECEIMPFGRHMRGDQHDGED